METIIIVVHIIIALAIIGLILMQQGKGAEAGASFGGGASQTIFGSQGGGSFFAKATAVLAVVFFASSFTLTILAKNQSVIGGLQEGVPAIEATLESDIPQLIDNNAETDVPVIEPEMPQVEENSIPAEE